jgi:aryl-alcohol dehydrogenase-like predicted oxidoreductase
MIGLGCMRLSTSPQRDDERAIDVIHAALDAGATLLDTSDAYCLDESDTGHNERLIARALATWSGERASITVATKGGIRRPKGAWVNDGRAKYLHEACDASRRALGVDVIDLYQLHAVDPRAPIETSVRALAALQSEGAVRAVGLCNVTVGQIEAARAIVDVAAAQVSLSVLDDENLRNGVAEYCREHGIRLIAYRPLGGERAKKLARDPLLGEIATKRGASPHEIALAWLSSFGDDVVPIPGATRVETARSIARVRSLRLDEDDRRALDARFSGRLLRVPRAQRRPADDADGDVVIVMGMPGAGKSTVAREMEARGYERLNRDALGGSLADLVPRLDASLAAGGRRVVLDNTYPTRKSRNEVMECAWTHGVPVRCVWLTTDIGDAQINAITRMIEAHGSLPSPEVIRERGKTDPRYLAPDAQFRYERTVEPPVANEGFVAVDVRQFARAPSQATGRAVVLDFDDLFDAEGSVAPGRRGTLTKYRSEGWQLFAHAWRPQLARGTAKPTDVDVEFARATAMFELDIAFACCPHDAGPPVCWCRKPIPGSVLEFAFRNGVSLAASIVVARSAADRTMGERLGATVEDSASFW